MTLKGLLRAMKDAGIRPKSIPVFLLFREMMKTNEDCRTAVACREIAEEFEYQFMFIHRCIKELVSKGWLESNTKVRDYTMIKLGPAYYKAVDGDTENDTAFDTAKLSKNQHESTRRDTENDTGFVTTGVSRLRRSSPDFDIISPIEKKIKSIGSERSASSPIDQQKRDREINHVKTVLLDKCQLYLDDVKLLTIDETGSPALLTLYRAWKVAYPAVDICAEIKKAHAWEVSNKERRKKNRGKFLNNWLSKEQERGGVFKNGPITHDKNERQKSNEENTPREIRISGRTMTASEITVLEDFKKNFPLDVSIKTETEEITT